MYTRNYSDKARRYALLLITPLALGSLLFAAAIVRADVAPTMTNVVHDSSHNVITSAAIGTSVHARASVASSTDSNSMATGTVDFTLYPNTSCTGTGVMQSGVALVNGVAESNATTVPSTGLSYLAHFNGQGDVYSPANSGCAMLTSSAQNTTLSLALSSSSIQTGSSVFSTATLGNATAGAGGSVVFRVYNNSACTTGAVDAGTRTVTNGVVPNSSSVQFNTAGTYYWQAVYGGDANNTTATTACVSGTVTNPATTTPPNPGAGSISGIVYRDVNKNLVRNAGEPGFQGWTVKLYTGTNWQGSALKSVTTDSNGYYSFGTLADGTYSVELINHENEGIDQMTADYASLTISNGSVIQNIDFGNARDSWGDAPDNDNKKHDKKWNWKKLLKGNNGNGNRNR